MSEKIYKSTRRVFLDSPRFVVPRYQREYSWQPQQIDQLLSDIDSIELVHKSPSDIVPKGTHFVGLLVFIDEPDEKGNQVFSVVDGQQRLSTFLLMASVAKDIISTKLQDRLITKEASEKLTPIRGLFEEYIYISSRPYGKKFPKLDPNINDKDIYEILVLSDEPFEKKKSIIQDQLGKRGLSRKYFKAYQHIYDYFSEQINSKGEDYLVDFFVRYDAGVSFIPFISESETDAFNLFECLNDRGMSLSAMDLIKNKVLQRAKVGDLEKFEAKWIEVIGAEGFISGDKAQAFIRNYLMLKKGHITNSQVYEVCKDLLPDSAAADKLLSEFSEYGRNFRDVSEVSTATDSGIVIHIRDDEVAEKLFLLNKTKVRQWQSLALSAYSDFKKGKLNKDNFVEILNLLLKLCVRFKLLNKRFNLIEKVVPELAQSLHAELVDGMNRPYLDVVQHCIAKLNDLIESHAPNDELNRIFDNGYLFDDNDFAFIMLRLIAGDGNVISHGLTFSRTQKLTLEHVLPEKYEQNWGRIENADELKYSLGNMLLIELTENVKLSNKEFDKKKEIYALLNPLDLVLDKSLKYQNATQSTWVSTFIKDRESDLVTRLKAII